MAVDIAPGLSEEIMEELKRRLAGNKRIQSLCGTLADGEATYATAQAMAQAVGEQTSAVLLQVLRPEVLPDGRMYYNIAQRTIKPALEYSDQFVSTFTDQVQTSLNQRAGLNVKSISARQPVDTIDNLCGLASYYEDFNKGLWVLKEPVKTTINNVVDRTARANAEFANAAGIKVIIVRTAEPNCCQWCADLEGTYDYDEVRAKGSDVYRRHNDCKCVVEYYPGTGNLVQNVHVSHNSAMSWRAFQ